MRLSLPTARQAGIGLALTVVAILAITLAVRQIHQQPVSSSSAPASGSTSDDQPTAPAEPSASTSPDEVGPVVPSESSGPSLDSQVKAFTEAYYLILPSDTEVSRRDRVTALNLAAPATLEMLDFTLNSEEVQYQGYGLTQQAVVDTHAVTAHLVEGADDSYMVTTPVTLNWVLNDQTAGTDVLYTVSSWQFVGDAWTVTDFSMEGGG